MTDGLTYILEFFLTDALNTLDKWLGDLTKTAFYAQEFLTDTIGLNFAGLFKVTYIFGIYLIILKLLKKGFEVYILWSEGDADMDPFILFTGFIKAIVVAITFQEIYGYAIDISLDFLNRILNVMNSAHAGTEISVKIVAKLISGGFTMMVIGFIYYIMFEILYMKFCRRGMEILILKLGVPLAAVGLMDSDGGVFKPYIKKFLQEILTVILQTFLFKISIALVTSGHPFYGIAVISFALKTPQFLQEFIMVEQGGQGVVSKATQSLYTASMVRSFVK